MVYYSYIVYFSNIVYLMTIKIIIISMYASNVDLHVWLDNKCSSYFLVMKRFSLIFFIDMYMSEDKMQIGGLEYFFVP